MEVTRLFTFEACHHLPGYKGKCRRPHGHSYKLLVTVGDEVKKNGMVIDFGKLKEIVERKAINKLDHQDLNKIVNNPTAENLLSWIEFQLDELPLTKLQLFETANCSATLRRNLI